MDFSFQDSAAGSHFLVTGGAGFIGSHLVGALLARGGRVFVLDDFSGGGLRNIEPYLSHPRFAWVRGDVRDRGLLERLMSEAAAVFHLAAAVGVMRVIERPVQTLENNLRATEAVLEVAKKMQRRLLIASSSEVYGKSAQVPFQEEADVTLGASSVTRWGYAASKMIDEFLTLAYHREYGLKSTIVRLFNTTGPRQSGRYGMVIPRLMTQAQQGQPLTIHGSGQQRRCFCDVRDVCRALIGLMECERAIGQVVNIGSQEEITIEALAHTIKALTQSPSPLHYIPYEQAYASGFEDMPRRIPDLTRIQELIGWRAEHSLGSILENILKWEEAGRGDAGGSLILS